jgi:hypothetical protein
VRIKAGGLASALAIVLVLLVAACDKEKCEPTVPTTVSSDQPAGVRKAAENSVRVSAGNPDSVRFRGVQVWPQAAKNQFAVCGQANVFGPTSNTFVLFVAVVTQNDLGDDPTHALKAEARVGSNVTEVTRVYLDTLARCYEGGGPQNIMRGTAAAVPPMPSDAQTVLSGPAPAAAATPATLAPVAQPQTSATPQAAAASTPASGTVVMRQAGNIRTSPQGEVIRVEPQGKELRVFGEAAGGWLQVGDTKADGWVHSSLVDRR